MNRLLLALCLRIYPRNTRERDGVYLRDLALDLSDGQGAWRQFRTLLSGGVAKRFTLAGRLGRRLTRMTITAMLSASLAVPLLVMVTTEAHDEIVSYACQTTAGVDNNCAGGRRELAKRIRLGWDCAESPSPDERAAIRWTCTTTA